jgi:hypothetical protein
MKKSTILHFSFVTCICTLAVILLTGCPKNELINTKSPAYVRIKETDSDFIFLQNLKTLLDNTQTKRDSVNVFGKTFSTLATLNKHGIGRPVSYDSIEPCIDSFHDAMTSGKLIFWNETDIPKITYYEGFHGHELFEWLRNDVGLGSTANLKINIYLGMYTKEFVDNHPTELDSKDVGRISIFLVACKPTGLPLPNPTGSGNAPVYDLGGLYP